MERGDSSHDWVITIPAFEVHNGFWYKVVGSEAETDEYHVEVRSAPAFTEFEVTYHPRPYLHLADETIKTQPVNFRGVGEGGAIGAPAALTSAIEDALAPFGAKVTDQYLPPTRILELAGVL